MSDERFWLVWRPGQSNPTHRHATEVDACIEATRQAAKHPGERFYVLEAISEVLGSVSITARVLDPVGLLKRAAQPPADA